MRMTSRPAPGGRKVEHRGGEEQADDRAGDAQQAACECNGELGLEDDDGGHRQPIGARRFEVAGDDFGDGDSGGQANRVAVDGGLQCEVGGDAREVAGEAHAPGKALVEVASGL